MNRWFCHIGVAGLLLTGVGCEHRNDQPRRAYRAAAASGEAVLMPVVATEFEGEYVADQKQNKLAAARTFDYSKTLDDFRREGAGTMMVGLRASVDQPAKSGSKEGSEKKGGLFSRLKDAALRPVENLANQGGS